jgi:deoxyguanosine kinase
MNPPRLIAVEGPIGVGKETLAAKLAERLGGHCLRDEANPFLSRFYGDRQRYAFQAQLFFLLSRYQQLKDLRQGDLFQKQVVCDFLFEKNQIFSRLNLDERELSLHEKVYQLLREQIPRPDLVIYLYADAEALLKRLAKRSTAAGEAPPITEDYLAEVIEAYNSFFFDYAASPLLVVNTTHLDFERRPADLSELVKKMNTVTSGTNFWIPMEGTFS